MTGAPPATRHRQAEVASATAAAGSEREEQEQRRAAKANLDVGATGALFGSSVLLGCVAFLRSEGEAKQQPCDVRLDVSLLLAFGTFLSGKALMLLSVRMLGRRPGFVASGGNYRAAAKCLVAACAMLSALTLLSLLALLTGAIYIIGLAVILLLSAAGTCWFPATGRGNETAMYDDEEELDAASKTIISCA